LWQVLASNGQVIADGTGTQFKFTPDDNGAYTVTLTVTDLDDNNTAYRVARHVLVNNVAPTAQAGGARTVAEGDTVTFTDPLKDPGPSDTHTFVWHVSASNGQAIADGTDSSFHFVPVDDGIYTVTLTVTDDDGG